MGRKFESRHFAKNISPLFNHIPNSTAEILVTASYPGIKGKIYASISFMTLNQIRANRLNAKRSAGPRSAAGKARSAMNALKTGISAQSQILPGEDPAALEKLSGEFYEYHQPESPAEREVLDNIIHLAWLNRRYRRIDAQLMKYEMDTTYRRSPDCPWGQSFGSASVRFLRLQTRVNAADRAFHRNLEQLRLLEAERPTLEADDAAPDPPAEPPAAPSTPDLPTM